MVFSPAQQIIIKELCTIEFKTLENLLLAEQLGPIDDDPDITYEMVWKMHGCTRKDFDRQLIDTYDQFQTISEDPDSLFTLKPFDMIIFQQMLLLHEDLWIAQYPNALRNLWNKIFIWESTNEIKN